MTVRQDLFYSVTCDAAGCSVESGPTVDSPNYDELAEDGWLFTADADFCPGHAAQAEAAAREARTARRRHG